MGNQSTLLQTGACTVDWSNIRAGREVACLARLRPRFDLQHSIHVRCNPKQKQQTPKIRVYSHTGYTNRHANQLKYTLWAGSLRARELRTGEQEEQVGAQLNGC